MSASASRTAPISRNIEQIGALLTRNRVDGSLHLAAGETDRLLKQLGLVERQIELLEHELGAFRAIEEGRAAAGLIDDLALDVLCDGAIEAEQAASTIITPDFSKGRRS